MPIKRDDLINVRPRSYVARDFDGYRAQLLEHARRFFPDKIKDFSETAVGGLFLDFASFVGDSTSFYLAHQFDELDPDTAVESQNIERLLRRSNVAIVGAAPAIVDQTVYIQVPAVLQSGEYVPDSMAIPVVRTNSVMQADNGVEFILIEPIDFTELNSDGTFVADVRIGQRSQTGNPTTFIMARSGRCVSGRETTETFQIGETFVPFRRITLSNAHVTEIISVADGNGNTYYNVNSLTHDVVYRNVLNTATDSDQVPGVLKVIPAPYRFMAETNLSSRKVTLVFGGGSADTLEDDIIPDPSEFAISLPYSTTFSRIAVNPEKLLDSKTLGVASVNTSLSITYRFGGGLDHNVPADNIRTVKTLNLTFPRNPPNSVAAFVRGSIETSNKKDAGGGDDAPTPDDLKVLIPAVRNAQERIVTREDVLARVYSLPTNFGRVFRASVRSNSNNPLATQLFIISRTADQKLIISPDTLKQNLIKYLNPYRMITDAIDILDARVVNLQVSFDILVDPTLNSSIIMQQVLTKLQSTFNIKNFHIDQPLIIADIHNTIYSTAGVVSVNNLQFSNITGIVDNRVYSDNTFDVLGNQRNGVLFPPAGGLFEVKFPEVDVIGKIM